MKLSKVPINLGLKLQKSTKGPRSPISLLGTKNPKFVQYILGHGDVSLTLNVYSHVLPSMGDQTATAMDDALG